MIHLTISHIYGLVLCLSLLEIIYLFSGGKTPVGKSAGLCVWAGLLYASFISFVSFHQLPPEFAFNHQSGVLSAFSAILMLPPILHAHRYKIQPLYPAFGLFPFFLFFLSTFHVPLLWFLSFETLSFLLFLSCGNFQSTTFSIRYALSSFLLFLSMLLLTTPLEMAAIHEYASFFLFVGFMLRLYMPKKEYLKTKDALFYLFFQAAIILILIIQFNPLLTMFSVKLLGLILLVITIIILIVQIVQTPQKALPEIYVAIGMNGIFLPLLFLSMTDSTHQYSMYLFLVLPFLSLFLLKEKWTATKYQRGVLVMLMTLYGFPFTAGSIIWIHFLKQFTVETPLKIIMILVGILTFFFWLYLYHKIEEGASLNDKDDKNHSDLLLLGILLYNVILWSLWVKFPYFFGF
ncbi:MAG: hypothetical protein PHS99_02080 [Candidatus Marinimicrobia bacterium]|nr:hypothetical protein [Candidatus Neomarinimicrobiota bacterium]